MIICHPIDYPFVKAMLHSNIDSKTLFKLWNECGRKYEMGGKKGIAKWQLQPLVEQYTEKLRAR